MNFLVYRQNEIKLKDDIVVFSGEDARPFADDHIIMIADGLGGTGAIRHLSIVKGILDKEMILQTLFNGVLDYDKDENFVKYVQDSFVELYSLKDIYDKDHVQVIKKSSYFGSRIVCADLLFHFGHHADFNPETIFDNIASRNEQEKQEYLDHLGSEITDIVKKDISQVAKNANIIYESSIKNLKLLATTLCATLFREGADFVEAVYFTIGDSRPYVWCEAEGLSQIVEDQEGSDGGMNGCIHVGGDFHIDCKYYRFSKPCVLFNATDGCFEAPQFLSQMAFEKLILDAVTESNSIDEVEKRLVHDYDTYGRHDDSSSLAMRCFGYDSFESFKEACNVRTKYIADEYLARMEDLLTTDYVSAYRNVALEMNSKLNTFKNQIILDEKSRNYCADCIKRQEFPKNYSYSDKVISFYTDQTHEIESEIAECNAYNQDAFALFKEIIARNFIKYLGIIGISPNKKEEAILNEIESAEKMFKKVSEEYQSQIRNYQSEINEIVTKLSEILKRMAVTSIEADIELLDKDILGKYFEFIEKKTLAKKVIEKVDDIGTKRLPKTMQKCHNAYVQNNKLLAESYDNEINEFCQNIVSSRMSFPKIEISDDVMAQLTHCLETIKEKNERIDWLTNERMHMILNDAISLMINSDYINTIYALAENDSISDATVLESLKQIIEEYKTQAEKNKEKAELQAKLFEEYNSQYGKYMG